MNNKLEKIDTIIKDDLFSHIKQIIATLWRQLTNKYGTEFSDKNLRRMVRFADAFSDFEIVASLMRQLSWPNFKVIYKSTEIEENRTIRKFQIVQIDRHLLTERVEI